MKYQITFEKLNKTNKDTFLLLVHELFKAQNFDFDDNLFEDILSKKYKDFYPIMDYFLVKINNELAGIVGYYNSFLFKDNLWLGWCRTLPKFDKINAYERVLLCVEKKIEMKYNYITHLRQYNSIQDDWHKDIDLMKRIGYIQGTKYFSNNHVNDIIILSKPLNGNEYKEWTRKPIW